MPLLPRSLKWRVRLLTLLGLAAVLGPLGYVSWQPLQKYLREERERERDRNSNDPLTRAMGRGQIRAGTTTDELVAFQSPLQHWRHDQYETLNSGKEGDFGGIRVVAVEGRLVSAYVIGSFEGHVFFDTMSPEQDQDYKASRTRYFHERNEQSKAPHRAVGGVTGTVSCWSPYRELADPPPKPSDEKPWEAEEAAPHRAVGGVTGYMSWCSPYWQLASPELVEPKP